VRLAPTSSASEIRHVAILAPPTNGAHPGTRIGHCPRSGARPYCGRGRSWNPRAAGGTALLPSLGRREVSRAASTRAEGSKPSNRDRRAEGLIPPGPPLRVGHPSTTLLGEEPPIGGSSPVFQPDPRPAASLTIVSGDGAMAKSGAAAARRQAARCQWAGPASTPGPASPSSRSDRRPNAGSPSIEPQPTGDEVCPMVDGCDPGSGGGCPCEREPGIREREPPGSSTRQGHVRPLRRVQELERPVLARMARPAGRRPGDR
jgi:hypothetical protein